MRTKQGFTLIEMLVVVIILSIIATFTFLSINGFGKERKSLIAAEQFLDYIKFLQQHAIITNNTYGILIQSQSYIPYLLKENKWQQLNKTHFREQKFAYSILINNKNLTAKNPQIIIDDSGGINNFSLNFGSYILYTNNGELRVKKEQ